MLDMVNTEGFSTFCNIKQLKHVLNTFLGRKAMGYGVGFGFASGVSKPWRAGSRKDRHGGHLNLWGPVNSVIPDAKEMHETSWNINQYIYI